MREDTTRRLIPLALLLLAALLASPGCGAQSAAQAMLQAVAPGVYVALQPAANRFNDSNATVIVTTDSVIVIDTQTTLTSTRAVLEQIRKLTDKPVRYVINTHWHGDHVYGNQIYRDAFPSVQFIAQTNTREDMSTRAAKELKDNVESLPGRIESRLLSELRPFCGKPMFGSSATIQANRGRA